MQSHSSNFTVIQICMRTLYPCRDVTGERLPAELCSIFSPAYVNTRRPLLRKLASLAILLFAFTSARADQLIVNGGFETGSLAGWTTTSTGDGGFSATSPSVTPLTYNATVGPHSGSYYAVSDDYSASQTQYLTQTFTTPTSFQSATLSFAMFVNDIYGADYGSSGVGGQVSLLNSLGSLIATLYGPVDTFENPVGSPNPYVSFSKDISSYLAAGTTYQLQFSSADSTDLINIGVDDVSLITSSAAAATPEPSTISLMATGGMFVFWIAYRKSMAAEA